MHALSLPYPDDLLVVSGKAPQELEEELTFLLAVKLFEVRRLSLGKAAEFCHMGKVNALLVIAVMHLHRLPEIWKERTDTP